MHTKIDITLSDLSIFRTKSLEIQREALELCLSYRAHFYCHMVPIRTPVYGSVVVGAAVVVVAV